MVPYGNLAGNSGVAAYQIDKNSITVQFIGGDTYLYTNNSAGVNHIMRMKQLAMAGHGLSTFISTTVKDRYERKTK